MKKLLSYVLFLTSIQSFAQTGNIQGKVTTSDGKPAEFVNVVLERTTRGATVDEAGHYTVNKIPAGEYTLVASFTGLVTQKKQVTIATGESLTVDFTLAEYNQQLQEVIVRASANRVTDKSSEMVARMPISNLQNPQAFNVVGKELMKQQNVVAITDAFKNAPGVVAALYPSGGIGALSRGFSTGIDARNGLQTTSGRGSADIANVERIEFIKGPSGTLFGAGISSFGGVVNLVTKKPFETFRGSVDLSVGSFGLGRISADVNTPLNAERSLLLRVNTALQRQDSYNERGFYNSALFAPSVLYKPSNRLSVLVDAEIYSVNSIRPTYVRITPDAGIRSYADIPLDYKKSLLENDLDAKTSTAKFFTEAKYRLNDGWTSTTHFSYVNESTERSYQDYPVWISPTEVTIDVSRYGPVGNNYVNLQQNFNGSFLTGPLKHTVLAGANVTISGQRPERGHRHYPHTERHQRQLAEDRQDPGRQCARAGYHAQLGTLQHHHLWSLCGRCDQFQRQTVRYAEPSVRILRGQVRGPVVVAVHAELAIAKTRPGVPGDQRQGVGVCQLHERVSELSVDRAAGWFHPAGEAYLRDPV